MTVEINPPFRVFTDVDGEPLEDGFIHIGAVNQNPQAVPISVFWDQALTIPAAQPIRTLGGYPSRTGTPSRMYVAGDAYSISVLNKNSTLIYSDLDNRAGDAGLRQDLANATDPAKGASIVGRSVSAVSVRDYTGAPDGVTSNQAGIEQAIQAAIASGADLFWAAGTYVTDANIPGFHSARHAGPGVIKRGTDTFKIAQRGAQINKLYVSAVGVEGNDGLTSAQPMATFQAAFDTLQNYGPMLDGVWQIHAAAGIYDFSAGQQTFSVPSKQRVAVLGPAVGGTPNVPTAIIDGGGMQANYSHGLALGGPGVYVQVQDIKAQNFLSSGNTRLGFVFDSGADVYTNNIHSEDCSWAGITTKECNAARIQGGILDAGGVGAYGFISDSTRTSFGYNSTSTSNGPLVKNALSAGVYWATGSQGHCDFVTFEDNSVGFLVAENSRCDTVGNNYKRNTVAKRAVTGGISSSGGAVEVFNDGTADANGTNLEYKTYSGDIAEMSAEGAGSWQRVAFDRANHVLSGTTPTTLSSPYTIIPRRMQGVGKACRVHAHGNFTQATAGSTLRVVFGGMTLSFTVPGAATNVPFEVDVYLDEVAGGYRAFGKLSQGLNQARLATATSGFDNTAVQAISIAATLSDAGDSMNLYRVDVYLLG